MNELEYNARHGTAFHAHKKFNGEIQGGSGASFRVCARWPSASERLTSEHTSIQKAMLEIARALNCGAWRVTLTITQNVKVD